MNGQDQAAHHAAMLDVQQQIAVIESEALRRPLTVEEVTLLQWATGVQRMESHHVVI